MPFVPAPNIVMVEMRALRNGQRCENRVMVNNLAAVTPAALTDLANIAMGWWPNFYAPLLDQSVSLTEIVATDLTTQNGEQVTLTPAIPVAGELTTSPHPNEVSFCISLRSGARGRSSRGRFYWLSVNQSQMSSQNELTTAAADAMKSAVQGLINNYNDTHAFVIVSYRNNNAPRPGGPVYFQVTSATYTDLIVDSMRRRKPGVGS